jgi:CubicO group peptidase (beta-lactamase class C family)
MRLFPSSMTGRTRRSLAAAIAISGAVLTMLPPSRAAQNDRAGDLAKARATDPVTLGWMTGTPPPLDKQIHFEDGSFYKFPQWRWSFSHWRELRPTLNVSRGAGPVRALPRAERADIDAVTFVPIGGGAPLTWADSLTLNYTDGIVVLHRGRIVYERYFGALDAERSHIGFSVTKSFTGTLAAMLIAEGPLDPRAKVSHYLPELATSGFGDATVSEVLDMTTALDFTENYVGESKSMDAYRFASGFNARPANHSGPRSIYEFLSTVSKQGTHGERFTYRTPNVDVMGWILARVTHQTPAALLADRIWSRLGAESDAFVQVDDAGTPLLGSSLNARLRDLARFGEVMRLGGAVNGTRIVPAAVVDDIRRGGDREKFVPAGYTTLPGWSYHQFWWVSHDDHGVFMARGIHGQALYIDPKAEMVIARFASHPLAGNLLIDPLSLPAYRAIADHLMTTRQ